MDIYKACLEGQLSLVQHLAEDNSRILATPDADERSPLHYAVSHPDVVHFLLSTISSKFPEKIAALVDAEDGQGWTALHSAASAGNLSSCSALVEAGAEINKQTLRGQTALHFAAGKGHVKVVAFMLANGADVNAKDKAAQNPLHRAASAGHLPVVLCLLEGDGKTKTRLNTADRMGDTPLHLAYESAHNEVAVALIKAGAARDRPNQDGQLPHEVAGVGGQEQIRMREFVISECGDE